MKTLLDYVFTLKEILRVFIYDLSCMTVVKYSYLEICLLFIEMFKYRIHFALLQYC